MNDLKNEITAIFNSLTSKQNAEKAELLSLISDNNIVILAIEALNKDDIQSFNYICEQITSPIEAMIYGADAKHKAYYDFAVKNHGFIERNFCSLFRLIEGSGCSADKSRTVMRKIVNFLRTGEEIKFNYDTEYTFNLPKKIFKTHEEIYAFFIALMRLNMGYPEEFIVIYGKIIVGIEPNQ